VARQASEALEEFRFDHFRQAARLLLEELQRLYGPRLVSVVVFGSVARGTPRPDSDLDVLLVVEGLPRGRMRRMEELAPVCDAVDRVLAAGAGPGAAILSPVIKTPAEVAYGSPLFLDMVEDACILFDRDGFFHRYLERLRERLRALGARRIPYKGSWYWDLKPDFRPGDVIEL